MQNKVVVFDLEDTLYKEIDFLKSGYIAVADYLTREIGISCLYDEMWQTYQAGEKDVFQKIIDRHHISIEKTRLINAYRYHIPQIQLDDETKRVLGQLQSYCHLALITDGRTETKKNVIMALGIHEYIDWEDIYISEDVGCLKIEPCSCMRIMEKHPNCHYVYIGDNPAKDFFAPNKLGWDTICLLDDGRNIHKQDFSLGSDFLPKYKIKCITELLDIIKK